MSPRVEVVTDLGRAREIEADWEQLAEECDASPMMRPAYALSWWEHLGRGTLRIVTVRSGDRLVALAPLHQRHLGPLPVVRWLGQGLGTVSALLVAPGHADATAPLWRTAGRGRVLQLIDTREDGAGLADLLATDGRRGHRVAVAPRDRCPTMPVAGDHTAYLLGREHKRIRKSLAKGRRRAGELGLEHRVEVADDAPGLAVLLPDLREVWDAAEAHAPKQHFLRDELEPFTLDLLHRSMARGQAAVLVGYLGDRPASSYVWLRSGTTMLGWVCRFHPDFAHVGPGHLMLAAGYDLAHADGYTDIDLGLGDSPYKASWTAEGYDTVDVLAGAAPLVRLVAPVLRRLERRHETGGEPVELPAAPPADLPVARPVVVPAPAPPRAPGTAPVVIDPPPAAGGSSDRLPA